MARRLLRLLERVRNEARLAGGDVVILAGNPEAEFLAGPGAPKGREFAAQLAAAHIQPADVGKESSARASARKKQLLADYAAALGVAHIVEGHGPSDVVFAGGARRNRGEMFQRFGLLFLIDCGMSEGVDDSGGAVLPHHVSGRGTGFGDLPRREEDYTLG